MNKEKEVERAGLFPKGEKIPEQFKAYFSGETWLSMLVPYDSDLNCPIANVTFEPGCRNNWHIHAGGQILLVTDGRGYYQEEGKEARELLPGDVVMIPANVKHWHGAAKDSWFSHLSIEANIAAGAPTWLEAVEDSIYDKLK